MSLYEESVHKAFDRIRHSRLNAYITLDAITQLRLP